MKNIDTIHIELTDMCNLNCNYCYHMYYKNKSVNVNSTYMSQLDAIKNSDISSINITGGEPTLEDKLYDLADIFVKCKNIAVTTNGIKRLITLDMFNTIIVSIDGYLNEMTLNRNVSKHQYEKIIENISYYLDAGKNIQLNIVITKNNIKQFSDFIKSNKFGNRLSYSIVVVSDKTLNKHFVIEDQSELNYIGSEIFNIYKDCDYHIKIKSNLMTKANFIDTFSMDYPITYFITYSLPRNKYKYINGEFDEYDDMFQSYNSISQNITKEIIVKLDKLKSNDFFNPYSLAEIICTK